MKLIDVHAHLETKRFEKDLKEVVERARKKKMIVINAGVNPATNRRALEIAENPKYSDVVKVSFGMYPIDALAKEISSGEAEGFLRDVEKFDVDDEIKWIEKNKDKCVAIGEIGLDYNFEDYQTDEAREMQKKVFVKLLKLAKKIDKPVIIHSRKAELDAMEILEKEKTENVVMHCFSAKKSLIKRGVDNKWFFSVPPVITRLQHFQTLVEMVPLTQILTETDSPYLSPVAGERNEPANVSVTISEIAKIKKISEKEVAEQIWKNAEKVFGF